MCAQNGISTVVTQKLLEHSSPNLTNKVYTNIDPVLRYASSNCRLVTDCNIKASSLYFLKQTKFDYLGRFWYNINVFLEIFEKNR